jgi:type IV secretion system protein VirD4
MKTNEKTICKKSENECLPLSGARYATTEEIAASLTPLDLAATDYPAAGSPLFCTSKDDMDRIYVDTLDNHTINFGGTGSKKTRNFCEPTVELLARAGESLVITDPKGEIYERCSGILKKNGYRIIALNFRDPSLGNCWNPLAMPYQYLHEGYEDKAMECLTDIVDAIIGSQSFKEPYWDNAAKQLLQGLAAFLLEYEEKGEHVNILSVIKLVQQATYDVMRKGGEVGVLTELAKRLPTDSLAGFNLIASLVAMDNARRTFACVVSNLNTGMRLFTTQKSLTAMLSKSDFDIRKIGLEKTALFLITQDEKTTLNSLVSLFVKQLYQSLIDQAQAAGGRLPVRVNYLLDEFTQLPTIADMVSMISAARSRNIRFALYVQSLSALREKYGKDAEAIIGNCENIVYLASKEMELLKYMSELCGCDEYGRRLFTTSDLQHLSKQDGEALVLHQRQHPFLAQLPDIADYPFKACKPVLLVRHNAAYDSGFDVMEFVEKNFGPISPPEKSPWEERLGGRLF